MNEERGLSNATIFFMIVVALFFDAIQIVIQLAIVAGQIISEVLNVVVFLIFFLWFMIHGIRFLKPKRLLAFGGGFLVEAMTLGILPVWTISVAITALDARVGKIVPVLDIISKK